MMDFVDMIWDELELHGRSFLFQPDWNNARLSIFFETIERTAEDYGVAVVITRLQDDRFEIYLRNRESEMKID